VRNIEEKRKRDRERLMQIKERALKYEKMKAKMEAAKSAADFYRERMNHAHNHWADQLEKTKAAIGMHKETLEALESANKNSKDLFNKWMTATRAAEFGAVIGVLAGAAAALAAVYL